MPITDKRAPTALAGVIARSAATDAKLAKGQPIQFRRARPRTTIDNRAQSASPRRAAALPTGPMEREAAAVGLWENEYTGRKHPRLQILTLAELFQGRKPDILWVDASVLRKAKREDRSEQGKLI